MATRPTSSSVRVPFRTVQRPTLASVSYRLSQLHGESASKWEQRMTGPESSFRHVALMLTELRAAGLDDAITERMALIEAALGPTETLSLREAVNRHNMADALEDCSQSEFLQSESDQSLENWTKRVAAGLNNDQRLLACLVAEKQRRRGAVQ